MNRCIPYILFAAMCLMRPSILRAQEGWRTGRDYWRQLDQPVGIHWVANPLRQALANLARNQRVFIWLDRRIDPDREVTFDSAGASLEATLRRLSANLGGGVGLLDSVVYLGPAHLAPRLATVAALRTDDVQARSGAPPELWLTRRSRPWADLTTPRELLETLAGEGKVTLANPQDVPHDLWAAAELPPLSLPDRLSLVLAGFDLTFELDAAVQKIRFVPFPPAATLTRGYSHRGQLDRILREGARMFPDMQLKPAGAQVAAAGSYENHIQFERWLKGEKVSVAGAVRYALKIENQPLGAVIQGLARRLGYRLEADPRLAEQLGQLVSFRVENATPDELLQAAVRNTGITLRRQGDRVTLSPADDNAP